MAVRQGTILEKARDKTSPSGFFTLTEELGAPTKGLAWIGQKLTWVPQSIGLVPQAHKEFSRMTQYKILTFIIGILGSLVIVMDLLSQGI